MEKAKSYCITIWNDEICVSRNIVNDTNSKEDLLELKHFNKSELDEAFEWIKEKVI